MRALVSFAGLAGGVLLLAGCSGAADDTTSPEPAQTDATAAPTSEADPTVGNLDDSLCAAAEASIEVANQLESKTDDLTTMLQDTTFLTTEDATDLNQWGEDMLTLTTKTQEFYQLGVTETAGEDINADFTTLTGFVEKYTIPLAQAAASAETPAEFVTGISDTFSDPDVQSAVSAAPTAAQNVATYLGERCDVTG